MGYSGFEVRSLVPDDAEATQHILRDVWDATYVRPGWMTDEQRKVYINPPATVARQRRMLTNAVILKEHNYERAPRYSGAVADGKLVGIVKWAPLTLTERHDDSLIGDPDVPSSFIPAAVTDETFVGYVEELDIATQYRRRKIGSALLGVAARQMLESSLELSQLHLDVVRRNLGAKAFYEAVGLQSLDVYSWMPGIEGHELMLREAMHGKAADVAESTAKQLQTN